MSDGTKIEWTDATWNPITGCSVVSPGCTNCYAMKLAGTRLRNHPSRAGLTHETKAGPVWNGQVRFNEEWLTQPLRWKRPRRIFVCAHGDLFHEDVPDEWIDRVFAVMGISSWHTFQVLTKRALRLRAYMQELQDSGRWLLWESPLGGQLFDAIAPFSSVIKNIWLGVSVEDQKRAEERIPVLLDTPAAVRFISAEPLLAQLDLSGLVRERNSVTSALSGQRRTLAESRGYIEWKNENLPPIDWVIVGGESGQGARPMHPDWARSLRDQCVAAGVAFHFKQWGSWQTVYDRDAVDPDWRNCPKSTDDSERYLNLEGGHGFHGERVVFIRDVGKKAAGRLLDGREWNEFPDARAA